MKLLMENWRRYSKEFLDEPISKEDPQEIKIDCNPHLTGLGVIPPNETYMSLAAAQRHFELDPKAADNHYSFESHYGKKHDKEDIKNFVFVTNAANYYTQKHPDDWENEVWENAVNEIERILDKCGRPKRKYGSSRLLAFEVNAAGPVYRLLNIDSNKLFISMLRNKRMPKPSRVRDIRRDLIEKLQRDKGQNETTP